MSKQKPIALRRLVIFLLLGVVLISLVVLRQPLIKQLNSWDLLPKTEPLSELYFTSPKALPTSYAPGQPLALAFTIHNATKATHRYEYQIFEQNESKNKTILETNTVTIAAAKTIALKRQVTLTDLGTPVEVGVDLRDAHQTITVWLPRR